MNTKRNLKQQVYKILKDQIIECKLLPGSIISEVQLSEELSFSRTPIREAISILQNEGFVKVLPKKGIYVNDITLHEITQIFQARLEIEPLALRLAKDNLELDDLLYWKNLFSESSEPDDLKNKQKDKSMHSFLVQKCGNQYIIDMMTNVLDKNLRIVNFSKENSAHIEEAKHEHVEIIDALIDKEIDKACLLMRNHLSNCQMAAMKQIFYN